MKRPICGNCPYWNGFTQFMRGRFGEGDFEGCRRSPPVLPGSDYLAWDKESGGPGHAFDGVFPSTRAVDFCGEHPDFPAYIASLKAQGPPSNPAT
jgi:hypothetical protein